ncbi:hypothetical protein R1flu_005745 [Riccia fluitans]|uniref:Exostosin GT47 domain-containing protein n=1 Tax=Riccia fluitans TaxID=41844 RepID=A0ABD1YUM4_9MARC
MINRRGTLCAGRWTIVVVVLLLGSFITFDSYTYRLLSTLSQSPVSLAFLTTSSSYHSDSKELQSSNASSPENVNESNPHRLQPQVAARNSNRGDPQNVNGSEQDNLKENDEKAELSQLQLTSTRRVELDLWQARAALKRIALEDNDERGEENEQLSNGDPHGKAYRNAALFRQSYMEMEDRFKIYIYQEGEEPLVHDGPCKEIYAVEGRFIQELQDRNPFVTSDPEEAHVFFLPFSVAMMVTYLYTQNSGDMSPLLKFVQDYVHLISHKYPYWNKSEGADHFMLSCHDWGPYVTRVDNNLYSKSIRVLCNANTSEGFIPYKDASLPEINLVGGEVPTVLGGFPVAARKYLAFFAGADHGPVRPYVFKHWEGKNTNVVVHRRVPVAAGLTYHEYMKSSKFCLCPGGYEVNSPRLVEAIYNDCIPVIIADKFVLPFSDVLDWSRFSLQILEADIPKLKEILEAVSEETLIELQNRVKQVRKHFLLNKPPERYDVFHMILHSVWLRRLNIRLLR